MFLSKGLDLVLNEPLVEVVACLIGVRQLIGETFSFRIVFDSDDKCSWWHGLHPSIQVWTKETSNQVCVDCLVAISEFSFVV
jgi:hypothetical protein